MTPGDSDAALAEELNSFFARFESQTQHSATSLQPPLQPPSASSTPPLTNEVQDVRRVLSAVNPRKAAGPDGVPGKVLKACANQLSQVFTDIFNRLFSLIYLFSVFEVCFKNEILEILTYITI